MLTKAAVTNGQGQPFDIQTITIDEPKAGEVLVKIVATGMCHSDLGARDQAVPIPLPAVLGHEGAGIVEKVGPGVTSVQPGDHVVLTFASCGTCPNCLKGKPTTCQKFTEYNISEGKMSDGTCRLHREGKDLFNFMGQSSFSQYSVCLERGVVKVPKDLPLEMLGPLGCGIQTGSGAVLNKLKPEYGSSIVVFGCGSVGLSAIMAANIASCTTIIAVDLHENRLELAKELGATHTINPKKVDDMVGIIQQMKEGGVEFAVDTTGNPNVLRQAVDCLAPLGKAVFVGVTPGNGEVKLSPNSMIFGEKEITSILLGGEVPQIFIPKLIDLYKKGVFPFDKLIKYYSFDEINQAAEDSESGKTIKPILKIK